MRYLDRQCITVSVDVSFLLFVLLVVGVLVLVTERWKIRTQKTRQNCSVINVVATQSRIKDLLLHLIPLAQKSTLIVSTIRLSRVPNIHGPLEGGLKTHVWSHTINGYLRRSPRRIGTSCFFSGTYDSNIGKSLSTPGPSTAPTHSRDRRSAPRAAKTIFQSENKIFNVCYNLHVYKISRMYNFMRRKRDLQNII